MKNNKLTIEINYTIRFASSSWLAMQRRTRFHFCSRFLFVSLFLSFSINFIANFFSIHKSVCMCRIFWPYVLMRASFHSWKSLNVSCCLPKKIANLLGCIVTVHFSMAMACMCCDCHSVTRIWAKHYVISSWLVALSRNFTINFTVSH